MIWIGIALMTWGAVTALWDALANRWPSSCLADELEPREVQHPRPWWYSLALRVCPSRCREIPEADNPTWCEHRDPFQPGDAIEPINADGPVERPEWAERVGLGWCKVCGAAPRILLRQVALWRRRWYLQQFACSEDPRFMHSHPAKFMCVIGLWGGYTERRIAGAPIERRAPYVYTMDAGHVHHVQRPGPGHTSLFCMFGVRHDVEGEDKTYYGTPVDESDATALGLGFPATITRPWKTHIRCKVARI